MLNDVIEGRNIKLRGGHSLADLPIFIVFCFFITSCTPVLYSYNSKICFVCFYRVWAACFDHRCGVGRVRWASPDWLPGDRDGLRKEREGRRLLEVRQTGEHHAKNGLLCMFFLFFIPISSIQNDFSTRGKKIKFETTALFACLAWMLSALGWPFGSMSWKKKVVCHLFGLQNSLPDACLANQWWPFARTLQLEIAIFLYFQKYYIVDPRKKNQTFFIVFWLSGKMNQWNWIFRNVVDRYISVK